MIIRGGENLYPREIEEFLYTHPKFSDVQVIGVPDPKYSEEILAWIKVKPGEQITEEELKEYCKGQIAHYAPAIYRGIGFAGCCINSDRMSKRGKATTKDLAPIRYTILLPPF